MAGDDQKLMWKYLKETVNRIQINQPIRKLYINNQWMENELKLAESLNRYFIDSVTKINNEIEKINFEESDINTYGNEFKFKQIDITNIPNIVNDCLRPRNMEDIYSSIHKKIKNSTRSEELRPIKNIRDHSPRTIVRVPKPTRCHY